jgi:hypothetical protein
MRAKTPLRYEVIHECAPGDCLVRLPVSPQARRQHPDLPEHWQGRLIQCKVGGQTRQFLTSLCEARRFPARDIAAYYVQRWEIELGFREIKQGMLKNTTTLRSKRPELVRHGRRIECAATAPELAAAGPGHHHRLVPLACANAWHASLTTRMAAPTGQGLSLARAPSA